MHTDEEWRPVVGFEGKYEVSDEGRIRSIRRNGYLNRVLMPGTNGYLYVSLGRKVRWRSVHSIVAEAFLGPRPNGMETCHNNGNPTDNRLENLRYDTLSANRRDTVTHGNNVNVNKTHCPSGHPYDKANTYIKPSHPTWRFCRTCHRERERARHHAA